uniref:Golgi associated, gamma adaptin ear containing, ARF binding protein 3a n=1 Tax=Oryzias sinensis TaxID=183150 RepID=A0A8C7XMX8_9TELE
LLHPSNRHEDWEYIMGFCDQINKELEGPQISVRLLAHKIQSPQEWEAMQALTVLEACLKNCGQRFHNEVGKFKFLNELIKLVSPKYLGDRTSEKVKTRVIEMLFSWTISLPEETKIREAYQMLKLQGIVLVDPEISADPTLKPPSSPRCKNPVFDDEKKSLQLAELLKSKKPEDLQEANRLIKNMVMEDEVRTRKAAQLRNTLEAANNSVKLLNEMLAHFNLEESTDEDKELIKELYNDCDKLQKKVFQLATESEDNDSHLGEILQASDDLSHVMNSYKMIVEGHKINGDSEGVQGKQTSVKQGKAQESASTNQSEVLIDLEDFDSEGASPSKQEPSSSTSLTDLLSGSITAHSCGLSAPSAAPSWLDEELLSLGIMVVVCCNLNLFLFFVLKLSCLFAEVGEPGPVLRDSAHRNQSQVSPVNVFDKNGLRVLLHFATNCPPGRPDVLVMVASMLNTSPQPVRNILLQAAVPKMMKVKLQSPSGTELAPFSPILPPPSITQVILLANPLKEKTRMRYKLTFTLEEQPLTEVGEVKEFPPADRWGAL